MVEEPSAGDYAEVWPADAYRLGVGGDALMSCIVSVQGLLDRCSIVSESPAGAGFGAAALILSRYFIMRPQMVNGVAVGGAQVNIPVSFTRPPHDGVQGPAPLATAYLDSNPFLTEAPSPAQIAGAFPKAAADKAKQGHAVLRCDVQGDGSLHTCEVHAQPEGLGFEQAAQALAKDFRVDVKAYDQKQLALMQVDLPIAFFSPEMTIEPKVAKPMWTHAPDPGVIQALYPAKAANVGVRTGTAHVQCSVAHAGQLENCAAVSEDPPGLGFGDAALQVAQVMAMNPWTAGGRPVDGAVIRMPVILKLPEMAISPPGGAQSSPDATPTNPDRLRRDHILEDYQSGKVKLYPARALREKVSGAVVVDCRVNADDMLSDCTVASEAPTGFGFGDTALVMTRAFTMTADAKVRGPHARAFQIHAS